MTQYFKDTKDSNQPLIVVEPGNKLTPTNRFSKWLYENTYHGENRTRNVLELFKVMRWLGIKVYRFWEETDHCYFVHLQAPCMYEPVFFNNMKAEDFVSIIDDYIQVAARNKGIKIITIFHHDLSLQWSEDKFMDKKKYPLKYLLMDDDLVETNAFHNFIK